MYLSRRQFIASVTALSSSLLLPRITLGADAGGGWSDFPATAKGERLIVGSDRHVHFLSAKTLEHYGKVEVGFIPHSFLPHPKRPTELWTVQRYTGRNPEGRVLRYGMKGYDALRFRAVGIDLATGEITGNIEAGKDSEFRGHGYFMPESNILFITRADMKTRAGHLTGYDVRSGKVVEDFKVSDAPIHEARYMPDGTVLIATAGLKKTGSEEGRNGAERPIFARIAPDGIARVDARTGKQLSFSSIEGEEQALSHMDVLPDGRIIAVSKSRAFESEQPEGKTGSVFIGREGGTLRDVNVELKLDRAPRPSEMFSIAVRPQDKVVLISDYVNGAVVSIDLTTDTVTNQWLKKVFGVVYDTARDDFIAFGDGMWKLNSHMSELFTAPESSMQNKPYQGSHGLII